MPDDSSGIYSVPAGTIVSTGDTILPSQHNPWANDSASAISNRFSKDGRAPATGNWNINSFRLTNVGAPVAGGDAVNKTYADGLGADKLAILQPSVDVASAATTDIGAAASQNVRITGTTTITGLGTAPAGTVRYGTFAGALTFTHNGTSLILPNGGSNITTAAGDSFRALSLGSGNWRVTHYQYYSPATDWVRTRISFSGSGSYSLTDLAFAKRLKITGTVQGSLATNLFFRVSTDNGSSYISTSSYDYIYTGFSGGNSQGVVTGSSWPIFLNNAKANTPLSVNIEIHNFNVAEAKTGNGMSTGLTSADVTQGHTFYFRGPSLTSALNAIQFSANSGNISGDLLVEYYTI